VSSFPPLEHHWFIACQSRELRGRPIRRQLLGAPVVLFRDTAGTAFALRDFCPHRSVPLSAGRVVRDRIECPYHGWQFSGAGKCELVPGLEGESRRWTRDVGAYSVREQDGFVWVYATPGEDPQAEPHEFAYRARPGYRSIVTEFSVAANLPDALENFLDTTHTHFLHGRVIRNDGKRKQTTVIVRRGTDSVEAEYVSDGQDSGLIARLFRGNVDTSIDRFLLPAVIQLEHRADDAVALMITLFFSPESESAARVFAVVEGRAGWGRYLLARTLGKRLLLSVVRQDREMLALQLASKQSGGQESYTSTQLDIMRPHLLRLLQGGATRPADNAAVAERQVRLLI
jgi:phenylpropionate dioxygenase-like ring-hydroxylating dioxygenase large terminal subunit